MNHNAVKHNIVNHNTVNHNTVKQPVGISLVLAIAACVCSWAPLQAQNEQFTYSVAVAGMSAGEPGSTIPIEATVRMTAAGLTGDRGVSGWSLSLAVTGATVTDVTIEDTIVSEATEPGNRFVVVETASDAIDDGVVSAIALGLSPPVFLDPPNGVFDILRLTLEATAPEVIVDADGNAEVNPLEVRLFFKDDLRGSGQPVKNRITFNTRSFRPDFENGTVMVVSSDSGERPTTVTVGEAAGPIDGTSDVLFMDGTIEWASARESGTWSGLTFTEIGAGEQAELLQNLRLLLDSNDNGVPDADDSALGDTLGVPAGTSSFVFDFSGAPRTLEASLPERFFLVGEPTPTPAQGEATAFLWPASLASALLLLVRRRGNRRRGGLASLRSLFLHGSLICLVAAFPLACSSGGGGGGGSRAASREARFQITASDDVDLRGVDSGINAALAGAPVQGPSVDL